MDLFCYSGNNIWASRQGKERKYSGDIEELSVFSQRLVISGERDSQGQTRLLVIFRRCDVPDLDFLQTFPAVFGLEGSWMKDGVAKEKVTRPQELEMIILARLGVQFLVGSGARISFMCLIQIYPLNSQVQPPH